MTCLPRHLVNKQLRAHFKAALRDIIDEDMAIIMKQLTENPVVSICSEETCELNQAKLVLEYCSTRH